MGSPGYVLAMAFVELCCSGGLDRHHDMGIADVFAARGNNKPGEPWGHLLCDEILMELPGG